MKTPIAVVLSVVLAGGVIAANQLGAQTTAPPAGAPTTPTATPGVPAIQSIVEITRAVPAGIAAVDAFTVPAGLTLVVTDIVVTNTSTAAACGGAVNRAGVSTPATPPATTPPTTTPLTTPPPAITAAPPSTTATDAATAATPTPGATGTASATATIAGTVTQTDSTVTGPLCVPAQSTTTLPLTTGIEFGSGQVVQLLNVPAATAPTGASAAGSLAFHLRGLLVPLT